MQLKLPLNPSDKKRQKYSVQRQAVIKYFNKVNRLVLVGPVALELKISLEEAENLLDDMCYEENPEIRIATPEELKGTGFTSAYLLTKAASPKLANDP